MAKGSLNGGAFLSFRELTPTYSGRYGYSPKSSGCWQNMLSRPKLGIVVSAKKNAVGRGARGVDPLEIPPCFSNRKNDALHREVLFSILICYG